MNMAIKIAAACFLLASSATAQTFQLGTPFNQPLGQAYRQSLEQLVVPAGQLPATCHFAKQISTAPIFPATTNPFVTDDAQLIKLVSLAGFGAKQIQNVRVAMSALYLGSEAHHELGIWGLEFSSPEAASASYAQLGDGQYLKRGTLLLKVWKDSSKDESCRQAIKDYLVLNGFEVLLKSATQ